MNKIANSGPADDGRADLHGAEPPSDWVKRWSHLVAAQGRVLDVACGYGRHAYWFYDRNHHLTLIDRAQEAIESIAIPVHGCEKIIADIEKDPWPLSGRQFDAVVVTNYLWRPVMADLLASLAPGGVLIYETFAIGQETVGRPSRPDFLLRNAELLEVCSGLRTVAYEDGFLCDATFSAVGAGAPQPRFVQRIAAVKQDMARPATLPVQRYLLG